MQGLLIGLGFALGTVGVILTDWGDVRAFARSVGDRSKATWKHVGAKTHGAWLWVRQHVFRRPPEPIVVKAPATARVSASATFPFEVTKADVSLEARVGTTESDIQALKQFQQILLESQPVQAQQLLAVVDEKVAADRAVHRTKRLVGTACLILSSGCFLAANFV